MAIAFPEQEGLAHIQRWFQHHEFMGKRRRRIEIREDLVQLPSPPQMWIGLKSFKRGRWSHNALFLGFREDIAVRKRQ